MTITAPTSPSISIAWGGALAGQCDPDFSFPTEEVSYRVPLWVLGAAALACASLVLTRTV